MRRPTALITPGFSTRESVTVERPRALDSQDDPPSPASEPFRISSPLLVCSSNHAFVLSTSQLPGSQWSRNQEETAIGQERRNRSIVKSR